MEEEEGSNWRREKLRLLMVSREKLGKHWSWKEGCPQFGEAEKGNGGVELNGGHGCSESDPGKQG